MTRSEVAMAWSLPAMVAMILDIGFLVYAVTVSVFHYRLHDGARSIFFCVLLCLLGAWTTYGTVASLLLHRPRRESALVSRVR